MHEDGKIDAYRKHFKDAYEDMNSHYFNHWPTRPGAEISKEQVRKYERKVTWGLFKSLCHLGRDMFFAKTIIEVPDLKIKPTNAHSVRTALTEREKFSRSRADLYVKAPVADPWKLGFSHKNSQIELSAVRLAFHCLLYTSPSPRDS